MKRQEIHLRLILSAVSLISLGTASELAAQADDSAHAKQAEAILSTAVFRGGLICHIGCGEGHLTAALRTGSHTQVQGLDRDSDHVRTARRNIRAMGIYGEVTIDRLDGDALPYIDNLLNLIVAEEPALGGIAMDEILRVLAPEGVALIRKAGEWTKTVKPRPGNIDEWTHFLHDASGNPVAHDDVVGPPKHLQWLGSPRWSRHHDRMASMSACVSAGGRVFYIMDEGSRVSIQLPPKWMLIARDAFNGTVLWKRPLKDWHNHLWPLKSGPTQLARRLVAKDNRVYVTLGLKEPLTALDAATGETVHTYEQTDSTEELINHEGMLFVLVNEGEAATDKFAPLLNTGDQGRVAKEFAWNEKQRFLMGIDADTGKVLWRNKTTVAPLTTSGDEEHLYYHDGKKVVALDRYTGKEIWSSEPTTRRARVTMNFGPRLVVNDGVVLYAGGDQKMKAIDSDTGKELWSSEHGRSGYQSPEDLLVLNGTLWNAPTTSGRDSGIFTGRDPATGKVKGQFAPDVDTYWFHHRCYIAKATDNFILTSRTGIEFVDPGKENWDIHHWVRGGCLYGIMPCNGLVYAPPHNCACYPEAKLYGFTALAPAADTRIQAGEVSDEGRLERGPAFDTIGDELIGDADWPTYRHDKARSGSTSSVVAQSVSESWSTKLGGKLTAPTIAGGRVYVAQTDEHAMHAIDEKSGKPLWVYTTGGRIDSPPTVVGGRVVFGSSDGWVYSLRASDGELAWRFRAAPTDRRLTAFEQIESVWPVHGSVLVRDGVAYVVAGRSNFLDGGLRFLKLNVNTGEKLVEHIIDDRDPATGKDLQDRLQVLQMPVGLPDILSSDDRFVYMRSQQFDFDGNRIAIGPNSADFAGQAAVQQGETAHLFAPMGFLDDTWFHRSYWVYGRSFAGGHAGYYQAGRFAPSGRILVHDDERVYGFARKPKYLKWTTILEHQLFASDPQAPDVPESAKTRRRGKGGGSGSMVKVAKSESIDPTKTPLVVEAWVRAQKPSGVVVAHGGPSLGYALTVRDGRPEFMVRTANGLSSVSVPTGIAGKWFHLAGVLTKDGNLQLYVNGGLAKQEKGSGLIGANPAQSLEIGADDSGSVGGYPTPHGFTGRIDEVKIFHGVVTPEEIEAHYLDPKDTSAANAKLVFATSFDEGKAVDSSGNGNATTIAGASPAEGRFGGALKFTGRAAGGGRQPDSFVVHHWDKDVPLLVRAMVKAGDRLFIAGPPDLVDEEASFTRLTEREKEIESQLAQQDQALNGQLGAVLRTVSSADGESVAEYKLDSLPVWDGMAAANGRLYVATTDGSIVCLGGQSD